MEFLQAFPIAIIDEDYEGKHAAGSMGPKVDAACRFVSATGKRAAIGALPDLSKILAGEAGTTVSSRESGIVYAAQ